MEATRTIVLRGGVSYASHIVGTDGMSPLVFDADDVKIAAGLEWRLGPWRLHAMGDYQFAEERTVSVSEALILPGQYSMEGAIALVGLMYVR